MRRAGNLSRGHQNTRKILKRKDNPLLHLFHFGQHLPLTEFQAEIITSVETLSNEGTSVNHLGGPFQLRRREQAS